MVSERSRERYTILKVYKWKQSQHLYIWHACHLNHVREPIVDAAATLFCYVYAHSLSYFLAVKYTNGKQANRLLTR